MGKKSNKPDADKVVERFKKLLKEMDELRNREMKRFSEEFDRRMDEFHELQSNVLARLGMSSDKSGAPKKEKATAEKQATKKAAAKKSESKKSASASASADAVVKAADTGDLTRVKGIGPATAQKMKDAGITDISQIAHPSAEDEEKLEAFKSIKGFNTLSAEAKKVL